MNIIDILYLIRWITLGLALCAITYKIYAVNGIRKTKRLNFSLRLLSFFTDEQIYSTNVRRKREIMIISNWATAIMLACLIPNVALILVNLASQLLEFIDSVA